MTFVHVLERIAQFLACARSPPVPTAPAWLAAASACCRRARVRRSSAVPLVSPGPDSFHRITKARNRLASSIEGRARAAMIAAVTAVKRGAVVVGAAGLGVVAYKWTTYRRNGDGTRSNGARVVTPGARCRSRSSCHPCRRRVRVAPSATDLRLGDRKRELDAQLELRTATEVTQTLGAMKGVLMKVGQLASFLDDGLPENVRASLAELQHEAPPMSAELAAGVIEEELGLPPDRALRDVGSRYRSRPRRSARSTAPSPRTATQSRSRCSTRASSRRSRPTSTTSVRSMQLMGMLFPALEPEPIVAELRARLLEELDYRNEAANQQLFADSYRDHPFIHVPVGRGRAEHRTGPHVRARRRRALLGDGDVGSVRARPHRGDAVPVRVPQPVPACTRSTVIRIPATTCSDRAVT